MGSLKNYTELLAQKNMLIIYNRVLNIGNDRNAFTGNCLNKLWLNYMLPIKDMFLTGHLSAWEMIISYTI